MTKPNPAGEPGDLIIDRYLPDASDGERDEARDDLRRFARALINVAVREIEDGR